MKKTVFKIRNKKTGSFEGAYSRSYHTEMEFDSASRALDSNIHDVFHDTDTYEIEEYEVEYRLVRKVPAKPEHLEKTKIRREREERYQKYLKKNPGANRVSFAIREALIDSLKRKEGSE